MPIVSLLAQPFRHPLVCLVTVDFFRSVVLQALRDLRIFTGIVVAKKFCDERHKYQCPISHIFYLR